MEKVLGVLNSLSEVSMNAADILNLALVFLGGVVAGKKRGKKAGR